MGIVEKRKSLIPIMKRALNNKRKAVLTVDKGTLCEAGAEADSYSDDEDDTVETNAYAQI